MNSKRQNKQFNYEDLEQYINQRGGDGHQGRTVFDTVYHGRPEYGFYSAEEMAKMGAKVGGSRKNVGGYRRNNSNNSKNNNQSNHANNSKNTNNYNHTNNSKNSNHINSSINSQQGGDGHQGHTVFDTVYHGRPEYGFYSAEEMAKMGAKVGGSRKQQGEVLVVEKFERKQKSQRGGFSRENKDEHMNRIEGIIENMIDVSDSSDTDILSVLQREINPNTNQRYGKENATQMLKEYYLFNTDKINNTSTGKRTFPSKLLNKYINENQKGGNRVVLPLTFFTGEIPNKITVPPHIDNYCE